MNEKVKIACVQLATRFRDTSLYPAKVRSIFEYVPLQPSKNKKWLDKSAVSASSPPVCPHSPMPGWSMKKGVFRSEVVVFISEIVFVFSEVVSFISEVDKTCVEVQGVVAHCSCIFPRARVHTTHIRVFCLHCLHRFTDCAENLRFRVKADLPLPSPTTIYCTDIYPQ